MFIPRFLMIFIPKPAAIPELLLKAPHGKLDSEEKRNLIPESAATSRPKTQLQPFDYDGDVYIGNPGEAEPNSRLPERGGQEQEEEQETPVGPRGDVFCEAPFCLLF